jgi:peptide/nickel transport system substrate-binding protein
MKRMRAFVILAIVLSVMVEGEARSGTDAPAPVETRPASALQSAPAAGDMIVIGSIGDASVLLPILAQDTASTGVTDLIYNGLLKYDKNIRLVGDLAESWEVSGDNLRIRFFLRKGVRWHDGTPFTARDVEYTYRAHVDPKTPTPHASRFMKIKELLVRDDHTVDVIYDEPFAPAPDSWVINKILPRHLLEGTEITGSPLKRSPVGTGPYKFKEWQTGEKIVLDANPDYFDGPPYISRVVFRIIPDQATLFLHLKSGGIDAMPLTELQCTRQTETPWFRENFKKYRYTDFGYVYLGYNLEDWKFKDRKVRQALTMAIDREAIIKCALLGMSKVAHAPYKPDTYWYNDKVIKWPYDPQKATRMLAEAGWKDTDGDGILDKNGKPFEFTIITNQGNEARKNAATIIQSNLKKVGIRVNVRVLEWAAFLKDFLQKRNFEVYLCGWISTFDPDEIDRWHSSKTGEHQFNHISYRNPEVDRLLLAATSTHDPKIRKEYYDKFQDILAEDQPITFLWVIERIRAVHSRFHGIDPGPVGMDYNLEKWYVPKDLQKYKIEP